MDHCHSGLKDRRHTVGVPSSAVVLMAAVLFGTATAEAGHVVLKNGMRIEGTPYAAEAISTTVAPNAGEISVKAITMIDSGMQRYYVPAPNVVSSNVELDLGKWVTFNVPQHRNSRGATLAPIAQPVKLPTPFDVLGQRVVTLPGIKGPFDVEQGIVEVGPKYLKVAALKYSWEFGLRTTALPVDLLDGIIRNVTDQKNPKDREAIARFYVQADLFLQALNELDGIARDFPELKGRVEQSTLQTQQFLAQRLLDELEHRRQRGQHQLAVLKAREFPSEKMSSAILRQVREFIERYEQEARDGALAIALLGDLQAQLDNEEQRRAVEPFRLAVGEKLNHETLGRLRPFLQQADDPTRTAAEKLALAYSGWVTGESQATDRLDLAINLWRARFLMLQYLRSTNPLERQQLLADLTGLEGIGPQSIMELIPNLPPIIPTPGVQPGIPLEITVDNVCAGVAADAPEVKYQVLLPTEYSPDHQYPVIVALHTAGRTPEWELRWWGGTAEQPLQAQRHGYIVIAPEYLDPGAKEYGYDAMPHYKVRMAVRDARKRFSINSNRVFLSGHFSGGDAAFDIGMCHPDLFAGVIPITGLIENVDKRLWKNCQRVPWYIVSGQLDRDVFERNSSILNSMMLSRYDVLLTEYVGRGTESYYEEIHELFQWMDLLERERFPQDFAMLTMRPNNNLFYWFKADTLGDSNPRGASRTSNVPLVASSPQTVRGQILSGAEDYTRIVVSAPARSGTLWLSPEMIDFNKRLKVQFNRRDRFNDFVESSVEAILEDLRIRGDRQKVYQARIDLN